jgi:hypothetical protein
MGRSTLGTRRWRLAASAIALTATIGFAPDASAAAPVLQGSFAGATDAFFGYSAAVSGSTVAIGAWNDANGNGAVYVYAQSGSTWALQQRPVVALDGTSGDQFGYALALSGNTLLVGAPSRNQGLGAAYVFVQSGSSWVQTQEITVSNGSTNAGFGSSVALSGSTAIIGAPGQLGMTGAAYVFTLGSTWQLAQEFAGGGASGDQFGFSVGVSPDATTAVVGAFGASNRTGAAYVLTYSGASWTTPGQIGQALLHASDGQPQDSFGYSVAASNGEILVGAYQNTSTTPGAAYVFTGSGASWSQRAKLVPMDGVNGDFFGYSVALSGNTALVGAYEKAGTSGGAYLFAGSGASWSQEAELSAPSAGQSFGYSVGVSGSNVAVGAISAASFAGEAYLYAPQGAPPPPPPSVPALGHRANVLWLTLSLAVAGAIACRRARGRA